MLRNVFRLVSFLLLIHGNSVCVEFVAEHVPL